MREKNEFEKDFEAYKQELLDHGGIIFLEDAVRWAASWAFNRASEIVNHYGSYHRGNICSKAILKESERLLGKQALEQDGK